jgi:hypothetical protein
MLSYGFYRKFLQLTPSVFSGVYPGFSPLQAPFSSLKKAPSFSILPSHFRQLHLAAIM